MIITMLNKYIFLILTTCFSSIKNFTMLIRSLFHSPHYIFCPNNIFGSKVIALLLYKGSYASDRTSGDALTLSPMDLRGPCFMTGGQCTLKVWTLNTTDRNLHSVNVSLGKIKRIITCIKVSSFSANLNEL